MPSIRLCLPSALAVTFALAACASKPPPAQPAAPVPPTTQARAMPATAAKPPPPVRTSAPLRYVVKRGDTLWGIASRFLTAPWMWPEIWYENPQIQNPHLIFPGDVITLTHVKGRPVLTVTRCGKTVETTAHATVTLHPCVERIPLGQAIPTIPYDAISALLSKPRVMDLASYRAAPYVLRPADGQLLAAAPNKVYARGFARGKDAPGTEYAVVQKNKKLVDPQTGRLLGYEVLYLGRARVTAAGDPATLRLVKSTREIRGGNRLVALESGIVPAQFPILTPKTPIHAQIIDVIDGLAQVGQYQVVVLDRGAKAGLETGDVLAIFTHGQTVRDPYAHGDLSSSVKLPNRRSGELIVFRAFPEVSYALVMRALRPIQIGDTVTNP